MTAPRSRSKRARNALASFVAEHQLGIRESARRIGCSHTTFLAWMTGAHAPSARMRARVEAWSQGAIRSDSWDASPMAGVLPYQ